MANLKQLELLRQGVEGWNVWRQEYPEIQPDLCGSNLIDADLHMADLSDVNLSKAVLTDANLSNANLNSANLSKADMHMANLTEADLGKALLIGANLSGADLGSADLQGANLFLANFFRANLSETNLTRAYVVSTIFGDVDLGSVKGLDTLYHLGPSTIGIDSIIRSEGRLPEKFLRGVGVPDNIITYARSLINTPSDNSSCFISYSSKDETFTKRFHADLQSRGMRCWFAPEDLQIGARIRPSIDESIRLHDKLLLVLSEHSIVSQWVEQEVETALEKERKEQRTVLFPIRLDNTVMDIDEGWPTLIRNTRHIGDFTCWKDHDSYQKGFERLLRDLKAETAQDEK